MIKIDKRQAPAELVAYRQKEFASYANMPGDLKNSLTEALMREQGYLCAYCMRRIPQSGKNPPVSIEHIIPQSENTDKALDYDNMLAVCNGNRDSGDRRRLTCDAHRGNQRLTINPLVSNTLESVRYRSNGEMYSDDSLINEDINAVLNLNCHEVLLPENRKSALNVLLADINRSRGKNVSFEACCRKRLKELKEADKKVEYCGIMIYWLENRLRQ